MRYTKLSVRIGSTINMGNFESARAEVEIEASLDGDALPGAAARLMELCQEQLALALTTAEPARMKAAKSKAAALLPSALETEKSEKSIDKAMSSAASEMAALIRDPAPIPPAADAVKGALRNLSVKRGVTAMAEVMEQFRAARFSDLNPDDYNAVLAAVAEKLAEPAT